MQIAYKDATECKDRRIYLKGIAPNETDLYKQMGFSYNRSLKVFEALPSLGTITELSKCIRLPDALVTLKNELEKVQGAVNHVRKESKSIPLIKPPVRANLYDHQVKALNMALLHFGVVEE